MSDLERRLRDLGAHLDDKVVPGRIADGVFERILAEDQPDVAGAITGRLLRHRMHRRLVAGIVLTVLVAGSAGAAAVRHWLVGGASVTRVATLPSAADPTLDVYGAASTLDEARRALGFELLLPSARALGSPVGVRSGRIPPGGRVTLLYRTSATLPSLAVRGVGAALTELLATTGPSFFDKMVTSGTTVETTTVHGDRAIWLSGAPHVVIYHAHDGDDYRDRLVLGANVLLWQHGELLLRLETRLDLDRTRAIAETVGGGRRA